jgi:hypothetical protein
MIVPSSHKSRAERRFLNWILALLTLVLLIGFGSELHGQNCTCEQNAAEICEVCEVHHLDSALQAPDRDVRSHTPEVPSYAMPISGCLFITDLDKDHPPPRDPKG